MNNNETFFWDQQLQKTLESLSKQGNSDSPSPQQTVSPQPVAPVTIQYPSISQQTVTPKPVVEQKAPAPQPAKPAQVKEVKTEELGVKPQTISQTLTQTAADNNEEDYGFGEDQPGLLRRTSTAVNNGINRFTKLVYSTTAAAFTLAAVGGGVAAYVAGPEKTKDAVLNFIHDDVIGGLKDMETRMHLQKIRPVARPTVK